MELAGFRILPSEIVCTIVIPFLPLPHIVHSLSVVSRSIRTLVLSHTTWEVLVKIHFDSIQFSTLHPLVSLLVSSNLWRHVFSRLYFLSVESHDSWISFFEESGTEDSAEGDRGVVDQFDSFGFCRWAFRPIDGLDQVLSKSESELKECQQLSFGLKICPEKAEASILDRMKRQVVMESDRSCLLDETLLTALQRLVPIREELNEDGQLVATYFGQFAYGKRSGRGKLVYSNGSWYDGEFRDGIQCGNGSVFWKDGPWKGDHFDGKFENGTIAEGVYSFASGDRYEGEFVEGIKQGTGSYFFATGAKFEGEWHNNMRHGTGKFSFHRLNSRGEVADSTHSGVPNAKGLYIWGFSYVGEWDSNQMHGLGTLKFTNGDKYVGTFQEDQIAGEGILYRYSDGDCFEGTWSFEKETGRLIQLDGSVLSVYIDEKGIFHLWEAGSDDEIRGPSRK